MTFVLDTNAYSAFARGDEVLVNLMERSDELIVPSIVAGELLAGFLMGKRWSENWSIFQDFLAQPGVRIHAPGLPEAQKYALLVKSQKEAGRPMPTNDLWIAATALSLGVAVLTRDAHFAEMSGLFAVGW